MIAGERVVLNFVWPSGTQTWPFEEMDFALLWNSWICQILLVYQTGIERKFHEYVSSLMYLTYEFPAALVIYQRFVYQTFGDGLPPKKSAKSTLRLIFCQVWGHVWSEHRNPLVFLIVRRFILPKLIACRWKSTVGVDDFFSLVGQKAYFHGWTVSFRECIL